MRTTVETMIPVVQNHRLRWEKTASLLSTQVKHILGNCCLAACCTSYLGVYGEQQRLQLRKSIEALCEARGLPPELNLNISSFLVCCIDLELVPPPLIIGDTFVDENTRIKLFILRLMERIV